MHVVAVIPTFNERDNLEAVVRGLRDAVADVHILVVDDASPDGTAELADRLAADLGQIDVIRRPAKSGLGSAYRDGFRWALDHCADACVQIDADLSHDPSVVPALLANVHHGADLAIGSRYVPGGATKNWPWRRRWLSRWGNRYSAGVLGLAVNDATSGYRAYGADVLARMEFETIRADGYGFQIEMTHRVVRNGGRIVEFPIEFRERSSGKSKLSNRIVSEAFLLVARLWFDDRHGRHERRRRFG